MITDEQIRAKEKQLRISAERRGYKLTLSHENIRRLLEETKCQYTGVEFDSDNIRSFERVDNTLGYEPGNVIPVTVRVNKIKSNLGAKELPKVIESWNQRYAKSKQSFEQVHRNIAEKVRKREIQLKELEALLARDKLALEQALADKTKHEQARAELDSDIELVHHIVACLERGDKLGHKYMTTWQRFTHFKKSVLTRIFG